MTRRWWIAAAAVAVLVVAVARQPVSGTPADLGWPPRGY